MTGVPPRHPRDELPTLQGYLHPLRRHASWVLVLMLLGGAVGTALLLTSPTRFSATSSVALAPRLVHVPVDPDTSRDREVSLDTSAALVRSDAVVDEIAKTTGTTPAEVRAGLTLSARPMSRVLVIGFRTDSREAAETGSHTAVEALLGVQQELLSLNQDQVRLLRNRVSLISAQAQERTDQGLDATALYETLTLLEDRLQRTLDSARTPSTVVRRTEVREYRAARPEVYVLTGLAAGLLLGLGLLPLLSRRAPAPARLHPPRRLLPERWLPA